LIDGNVNGVRDGADTGWAMFVNLYTQRANPVDAIDISAQGAQDAYESVLNGAGHSQHRDSVDTRIVSEVRNEAGSFINSQNEVGGFPVLNSMPDDPDTDLDGMPDEWETAHDLNPTDPADGPVILPTGYSVLEIYLNGGVFASSGNVTVSGRVFNNKGKGVVHATVTIVNAANGTSRSVFTGPGGYYFIPDVPTYGVYTVSAGHPHFTFNSPPRVLYITEAVGDLDFRSEN